jgi:hypothetical protein
VATTSSQPPSRSRREISRTAASQATRRSRGTSHTQRWAGQAQTPRAACVLFANGDHSRIRRNSPSENSAPQSGIAAAATASTGRPSDGGCDSSTAVGLANAGSSACVDNTAQPDPADAHNATAHPTANRERERDIKGNSRGGEPLGGDTPAGRSERVWSVPRQALVNQDRQSRH